MVSTMVAQRDRWDQWRIAVFDLDGTLYEAAQLRRRMAARALWHAVRYAEPGLLRVIATLRKRREELAAAQSFAFEATLIRDTAAGCGLSEAAVSTLLSEWFERQPLPHLRSCIAPGIDVLFASLRKSGRQIGVLSDYPAAEKLKALGLEADFVISAVDADVGVQKPHPRGLEVLLERAGRKPDEALVIGDRADRDGAIAMRIGASFLLRGRTRDADFYRYDDAVFGPVLAPWSSG
jgi:HAD superfamily hydrolase (TIGR01509 family)